MKWIKSDVWPGEYARSEWTPGQRWVYLAVTVEVVPGEVSGVCLTRIPESVPAHDPFAGHAYALANSISFPLGRGPGRPGGAPEVAALVAMAKDYAEKFAAGESLDGYPHWQQPTTARPADG